jgi:hypothetical protein
LAKFAATLKPETYTADGVEHKTFSIKADFIRKVARRHRRFPGTGHPLANAVWP